MKHYHTLFMHENVTELEVHLMGNNDDYNVSHQVSDIVGRMPSLVKLEFDVHGDMSLVESATLKLFRELTKLESVTLSKKCLTPSVLLQLSKLPTLGVIQFPTYGPQQTNEVPPLAVTLHEGAFPALWDLSLCSNLEGIKSFLFGDAHFSRLTSLYVECRNVETPASVHEFLSALVDRYPDLKRFDIDITIQQADQEQCELLSFETIRPLLSLKKLETLEVRHNHPLIVSEDNIAELAMALPDIQDLILNCEPFSLDRPSITLGALLSIAHYCRKIRNIGLYLDATSVDTLPTIGAAQFATSFRTLNLGVSPIGFDKVPVALFLSQLLASRQGPIELQFGVTWDDVLTDDHYKRTVFDCCERWDEVAKMLPLLIRLRQEEHDHRRSIEREVEDLRMRNDVLAEYSRLRGYQAKRFSVQGCVVA